MGRLCTSNIYIVNARASGFTEFTQIYLCYKFNPTNKNFWCARIPYLRWIFIYSGQTQLHYQVCLLNWKLNFSFKIFAKIIGSNFGCCIWTWIYNKAHPSKEHYLKMKWVVKPAQCTSTYKTHCFNVCSALEEPFIFC